MRRGLQLLDRIRAVKQAHELRAIREAARITAKAFSEIPRSLREGRTEKELAGRIASILKRNGADALAFPVIAAFGKNTAHVHHEPTARKLRKNEAVMLDFGAVVGGYCSDMTRTIFFGKPSKKFVLWYGRVLEAQKRAIAKVKDGAKAKRVDEAARSYLARFTSGKNFPHGTGHGVGLAIHEWPYLRPKNDPLLNRDPILRSGMVIIKPQCFMPD